MQKYILLVKCTDKPGIVSRISDYVFRADGNIVDVEQHSALTESGITLEFFMRVVIELAQCNENQFVCGLPEIAADFAGTIEFIAIDKRKNAVILVSKTDHCLSDLLYRYRLNELNINILKIISNHEDCRKLAEWHNIPFEFVASPKEGKAASERAILKSSQGSDFMVLARYMQILSPEFLRQYGGDIINIHHSFLPAFSGAHPYRQAYGRGVKIIGATAHFVTEVLDEGPIIEQMVEKVSHRDSETELRRRGRSLEVAALGSAVRAYTESRVIRAGKKTIVFQ